ncbi:hypothetical protein AVEN_200021-1 [Araneus ventricosus]|uniref:Uncharacterized protein n=1 Tax=Araneus ventricosus TaxID=182803 RepID=A0A4Y2UH46_ARAVE|nr:hypothetical protein AVEN_200021-1 [Araneus ventricosus]
MLLKVVIFCATEKPQQALEVSPLRENYAHIEPEVSPAELATASNGADLILLAREWEVDIASTDGTRTIIKKIKESPDFDNDFALVQIKVLSKDRVETERKNELERDRQYELEKLKLQPQSGMSSLNSRFRENKVATSLKSVMHKCDMENSDMTLYLNLFERQAKMAEIEETEWVNHLLGLLPVKLAEQVIKLPGDKITDCDFVKAKLLERFKLNAETLRTKFMNFQRPQGTLWKDLIFI